MSGIIVLIFIGLFIGLGKAKDNVFYSDDE